MLSRPALPAALLRPVALVGLMGVGKSTVGRRLAQRLAVPFIDADDEIERAANMKISAIFEAFGEAGFRDGERRVIARLIDGSPRVIATGGGAFIDAGTRALLLAEATTVWLDAPIDVLAERVSRSGPGRPLRPLLQGRDAAAVLSDLAAVRNPFYAQAPIHIQSDRQPHDETVDQIIKALAL